MAVIEVVIEGREINSSIQKHKELCVSHCFSFLSVSCLLCLLHLIILLFIQQRLNQAKINDRLKLHDELHSNLSSTNDEISQLIHRSQNLSEKERLFQQLVRQKDEEAETLQTKVEEVWYNSFSLQYDFTLEDFCD